MRRMTLVAVLALGLGGCGSDLANNSSASVVLRMTLVEGASGVDSSPKWGGFLDSDVITLVGSSKSPTIFNDLARLSMDVIPKNPNFTDVNTFSLSDVNVEQYEVRYRRSDGRNVEGVDVPFHISGPMAITIPLRGKGQAVIEVVRHTAKEEPPLLNIEQGNGETLITTVAEITVYGHTVGGQAVTATGSLQITFGNFGDPS